MTVSGCTSVKSMGAVIGASIFSANIFSLVARYVKESLNSCRKSQYFREFPTLLIATPMLKVRILPVDDSAC